MLTDFGLARAVDDATLTRTGIIAGTPQYMSPEQANGDAVDHRSDLFSLGSVLYAMCTARPPFRAETTFGVLRRIRETSPRPIREINADTPEWLERIVLKLLSKSPEDRLDSATEIATLLEQCLAHVQQPTTVALPQVGWALLPDRSESQHAKSGRSTRPTRLIALAFAVVAAVVLAAVWPPRKPIPIEPSQSTNEASALAPLLEWNATQSELDDTARMIEQLDVDAQRDLE